MDESTGSIDPLDRGSTGMGGHQCPCLGCFAREMASLIDSGEATPIELFPGMRIAALQRDSDPLFNQFFAFVNVMNNFFEQNQELDFAQDIIDDLVTEDLDNWVQQSNELPLILDTCHYRDMEDRVESNSCSICAVKFRRREVVALLECAHFFHERCIRGWGRVKPSCPICRQNIEVSETALEEMGNSPNVPKEPV